MESLRGISILKIQNCFDMQNLATSFCLKNVGVVEIK